MPSCTDTAEDTGKTLDWMGGGWGEEEKHQV